LIFVGVTRLAVTSVATPEALVTAVPTLTPFNMKVTVLPVTPVPPIVRVRFAVMGPTDPPYVPTAALTLNVVGVPPTVTTGLEPMAVSVPLA
jgi:hypothetical protein